MFRPSVLPVVGIAACFILGTSPISAQSAIPDSTAGPSRSAGKSAGTARALAIIPSAGHIYAGSPRRGLAFLGGIVGTLALGTVAVAGDCLTEVPYEESDCGSGGATATAVAALGLWGWSIYDAGRTARRNNARRSAIASLIIAPSRAASSSTRNTPVVRLGVRIATR